MDSAMTTTSATMATMTMSETIHSGCMGIRTPANHKALRASLKRQGGPAGHRRFPAFKPPLVLDSIDEDRG